MWPPRLRLRSVAEHNSHETLWFMIPRKRTSIHGVYQPTNITGGLTLPWFVFFFARNCLVPRTILICCILLCLQQAIGKKHIWFTFFLVNRWITFPQFVYICIQSRYMWYHLVGGSPSGTRTWHARLTRGAEGLYMVEVTWRLMWFMMDTSCIYKHITTPI